MIRQLIFLLLVFVCGSISSFAQSTEQADAFSDLTDFYEEQAEAHNVVGSSLAIIQDSKAVYRNNYGFAHLEKKTPVDNRSIFHWASITKTFTGIAIMQLRDRGLLSLDDPVTEYIPGLREVQNEYGSMDDITIRQLMSHTSGFRGPTWPWGGSEEWHPHEPQHWRQLEAMFPYTEIKFEPGSRWRYSNPGVIFLGRIIELITKDDYEYYVEKNILQPLQMDSSYFDKTPYQLLDNLAQSYYLQDDGSYQQARFDLNTGITVSNGGLSAPIGDMIKYLNFLLGNADEQLYEHVLSRDSIHEMFEPQVEIAPNDDSRENVTAYQMGLSFFVTDRKDMRLISHSGGQNGFISHIYMAPKKNMAYVVAYNNMGETRTLDRKLNEFIIDNIFSDTEHEE